MRERCYLIADGIYRCRKDNGIHDAALYRERCDGEQRAEQINAAHHLYRCNGVRFKQIRLPIRCETVKR